MFTLSSVNKTPETAVPLYSRLYVCGSLVNVFARELTNHQLDPADIDAFNLKTVSLHSHYFVFYK